MKRHPKVLMVAATPSMIRAFNMRNLRILKELGCDVAVATNVESTNEISGEARNDFLQALDDLGVTCHHVPFERGVGSLAGAWRVTCTLRSLQKRERFDIMHTHQPASSALARLAIGKRVRHVIYTAHGFQFVKGGPKRDWLLYFPVEALLSRRTHVLITVNEEDQQLSQRRLHARRTVRIPGVGIDSSSFQQAVELEAASLRTDLGIPQHAPVILSVGELVPRKNHASVIRAMGSIGCREIYYLICGTGPLKPVLTHLADQLGIGNRVVFAGFRTDIPTILALSDYAVYPSLREGLGVFGLEALAAGLPLIGSDVRGIRDYMDGGHSGYLVSDPRSTEEVACGITAILEMTPAERAIVSSRNRKLAQQFDSKQVDTTMRKLYKEALNEARL
jgi:glycosyltransferase involved in cell wall biosynthesis